MDVHLYDYLDYLRIMRPESVSLSFYLRDKRVISAF